MQATRNTLQSLTTEITSFRTWPEFAARMEAGYCPTLRPQRGRSKATREYNAKVEELRTRLESLGYKVFRGC